MSNSPTDEITLQQYFPGGGWSARINIPREWADARCGGMVGLRGGQNGYPHFVEGEGRIPSEALEQAEAAFGRIALAFLHWTLYLASVPQGSSTESPP